MANAYMSAYAPGQTGSTHTSLDGVYRLALMPDTYTLNIRNNIIENVQVKEDMTLDIKLKGAILSGRVTDPNGEPVVDVNITAQGIHEGREERARTNKDGAYSMELEDGIHTLLIEPPENSWLLLQVLYPVTVEGNVTLNITLERGVTSVNPRGKETISWGEIKNALLQNYPNPFNPETWIPYLLAEPAEVTIQIYSVTGPLVRIIHIGQQDSGEYVNKSGSAHWDGRNDAGERVTSGVYFYRIQAGDFTAMRKLVVSK